MATRSVSNHQGACSVPAGVTSTSQLSAEDYPHLAELTVEHVMKVGYRYNSELEFGLNIELTGLEQAAASAPPSQG